MSKYTVQIFIAVVFAAALSFGAASHAQAAWSSYAAVIQAQVLVALLRLVHLSFDCLHSSVRVFSLDFKQLQWLVQLRR